jgi:hypothetical protein
LENVSEHDTSVTDWANAYDKVKDSPPKKGDFLTTSDGSLIRMEVVLRPGQEPVIYTRCQVPKVTGSKLGWFCLSMDNPPEVRGWKVILVTRSRNEFLRRKGMSNQYVGVPVLKVIGQSRSGNSLLAEVADW